jgi:hypothetical protein
MKRTAFFAISFLLLIAVLPATEYTHSSGGIKIWFPDNWNVQVDESALFATAPDNDNQYYLDVLPVTKLEDALGAYAKVLAAFMPGFTAVTQPQSGNLHGMPQYWFDGIGHVNGVKWFVGVSLVDTGRAIVIYAIRTADGVAAKYERVSQQIFNSIQRI